MKHSGKGFLSYLHCHQTSEIIGEDSGKRWKWLYVTSLYVSELECAWLITRLLTVKLGRALMLLHEVTGRHEPVCQTFGRVCHPGKNGENYFMGDDGSVLIVPFQTGGCNRELFVVVGGCKQKIKLVSEDL